MSNDFLGMSDADFMDAAPVNEGVVEEIHEEETEQEVEEAQDEPIEEQDDAEDEEESSEETADDGEETPQVDEDYKRILQPFKANGIEVQVRNVDEAIRCYNRVLDDARAISDNSSKYSYMHLVYLRLGRIYLDRKEYEKAKSVFVDSCNKETPTVQSWLGIGKACYYQNQFDDAEDALAEANMLDQRQPDVWALLSAVCLQQSILKPSVCRKDEAEQSFKYAIKMGCNDEVLLNELNGLQIHAGLGDPSF